MPGASSCISCPTITGLNAAFCANELLSRPRTTIKTVR